LNLGCISGAAEHCLLVLGRVAPEHLETDFDLAFNLVEFASIDEDIVQNLFVY